MPEAEKAPMPYHGPYARMFGLTGTTSSSGASLESLETLKNHEPLRPVIERWVLFEDLRSMHASTPNIRLSAVPSAGFVEFLRSTPHEADPLIARITERRHRLLRDRGLFTDSVDMIRELRDTGP